MIKKICFCGNPECKPYSARIRIRHQQFKVGIYHSKCKGFTPTTIDDKKPGEEYTIEDAENLMMQADELLSEFKVYRRKW